MKTIAGAIYTWNIIHIYLSADNFKMHGSFLAKDMSYVASFISMNENCTMYHPKILCINGQTDRMIDRQTDGWQVSLNITNIQGYKKQETFQKKKKSTV